MALGQTETSWVGLPMTRRRVVGRIECRSRAEQTGAVTGETARAADLTWVAMIAWPSVSTFHTSASANAIRLRGDRPRKSSTSLPDVRSKIVLVTMPWRRGSVPVAIVA